MVAVGTFGRLADSQLQDHNDFGSFHKGTIRNDNDKYSISHHIRNLHFYLVDKDAMVV
jgi:hypothetical protein